MATKTAITVSAAVAISLPNRLSLNRLADDWTHVSGGARSSAVTTSLSGHP